MRVLCGDTVCVCVCVCKIRMCNVALVIKSVYGCNCMKN